MRHGRACSTGVAEMQQQEIQARAIIDRAHGLRVSVIASAARNYSFLLHDRMSGATAVVDPIDAETILGVAHALGWKIQHILNTHHHNCGGNLAIKRATGCIVHGPKAEASRIPGIDATHGGGDAFRVGNLQADVLAVPGHTIGHIAYWFSSASALFCGDTLSPLGCGRLVEGSARKMWWSLSLIRALPADTLIYSGFECAQANARFALLIEPTNPQIRARNKRIDQACSEGRATVPSVLEEEQATNPFLRADDPRLAVMMGLRGAKPDEVFAELRKRRDRFFFQPP